MKNIRIMLENETSRELEKMLGQAGNKGELQGAKLIVLNQIVQTILGNKLPGYQFQ